jgi:hypothetical protein
VDKYDRPWEACFGPSEHYSLAAIEAGWKLPCKYRVNGRGNYDYEEEQACDILIKTNCYCYALDRFVGSYCEPGLGGTGRPFQLPGAAPGGGGRGGGGRGAGRRPRFLAVPAFGSCGRRRRAAAAQRRFRSPRAQARAPVHAGVRKHAAAPPAATRANAHTSRPRRPRQHKANEARPPRATTPRAVDGCNSTVEGVLADGGRLVDRSTVYGAARPEEGHFIALAVKPMGPERNGDFHFWRLDANGVWSYKVGRAPARPGLRGRGARPGGCMGPAKRGERGAALAGRGVQALDGGKGPEPDALQARGAGGRAGAPVPPIGAASTAATLDAPGAAPTTLKQTNTRGRARATLNKPPGRRHARAQHAAQRHAHNRHRAGRRGAGRLHGVLRVGGGGEFKRAALFQGWDGAKRLPLAAAAALPPFSASVPPPASKLTQDPPQSYKPSPRQLLPRLHLRPQARGQRLLVFRHTLPLQCVAPPRRPRFRAAAAATAAGVAGGLQPLLRGVGLGGRAREPHRAPGGRGHEQCQRDQRARKRSL